VHDALLSEKVWWALSDAEMLFMVHSLSLVAFGVVPERSTRWAIDGSIEGESWWVRRRVRRSLINEHEADEYDGSNQACPAWMLTLDVAVVGDVLRHFILLAPFCFFRPWARSA
jgi:hypothetical protein